MDRELEIQRYGQRTRDSEIWTENYSRDSERKSVEDTEQKRNRYGDTMNERY